MKPSHVRSGSWATLGSTIRGAALGVSAWSLTEYVVHRWILHAPVGLGRPTRVQIGSVHRAHHGHPEATSPWGRAAGHLAIAAVGVLAGASGARFVSPVVARAMAIAWSASYSFYEVAHWNSHHRPPATEFGRKLRQRHFRHHFAAPSTNLGVTIRAWDAVFGTEASHGTVRVPARHAPLWLDELGPKFVAVPSHRP